MLDTIDIQAMAEGIAIKRSNELCLRQIPKRSKIVLGSQISRCTVGKCLVKQFEGLVNKDVEQTRENKITFTLD